MSDTQIDLVGMKARTQQATPVTEGAAQPLVGRDYSIPVTAYIAPDGQVHHDTLVSRILTMNTKASTARMESDLSGGFPFAGMSVERQAWIKRLAYVTHHLVDIPAWLNVWLSQDDDLLLNLYKLCQAHDYLFFRPDPAQGAGTTGEPRRLVVASDLAERADAEYRRRTPASE